LARTVQTLIVDIHCRNECAEYIFRYKYILFQDKLNIIIKFKLRIPTGRRCSWTVLLCPTSDTRAVHYIEL